MFGSFLSLVLLIDVYCITEPRRHAYAVNSLTRSPLASPQHAYLAFTKSYHAGYAVQYAGQLDASQQSIVVRGSWYTAAGDGDGGPFSMTWAQRLSIVDSEQPAVAAAAAGVVAAAGAQLDADAVAVGIDAAASQLPAPSPSDSPPAAAAAAARAASDVELVAQHPPPPYESQYQPLSESRSSAGSSASVSVSVSDVDAHWTQALSSR